MSDDGLYGLDDCSGAELDRRANELESTGWFEQLRALKPNSTGVDAFALGFAAGQRTGQHAVPVTEQTTVPSPFWLQTRAAVWSAVASAALTWLILSTAATQSPGTNATVPSNAPLAIAVDAQPLKSSQATGFTNSIEELMSSPWRARALVIEQTTQRTDEFGRRQSMPDTQLDQLQYVQQRRQWLTSLQFAP